MQDPADYTWSSYQCYAFGKSTGLHVPHEEYLKLSDTAEERCREYRELFSAHVDEEMTDDIRSSTNKGLAFGNDRFKDEIEQLTGRRVRPGRMGRPVVKEGN